MTQVFVNGARDESNVRDHDTLGDTNIYNVLDNKSVP